MGEGTLQGKRTAKSIAISKARKDLNYINDTFRIGETVNQLHSMMKNVTKEELSAKTVNAACNCVAQLNQTINTTINAAKYLSENRNNEE